MSKIISGIFLTLITSFLSYDPLQNISNNYRPEVKTPYGTFRGEVIKSKGGRDIFAFKGVPYAQQPVGKLRFMDPVKLDKREATYDAVQDKICAQPGIGFYFGQKNVNPMGVEDCLYLNIFVPKTDFKELLPVYFWIHGGGFLLGTGAYDITHPGIILDKQRNMVMVSINYRLGVLGFLSLDDEVIPGNLGMKDQVMALKWVKENIEAFGGDPNSITIAGQSAGGASVSLLLHSKLAEGLFHKAISHSGTHDCSWVIKSRKQSRQTASKLLSVLGCPSDPANALECLQQLPYTTIIKSLEALQVSDIPFNMIMTPVIENDSPNAFVTNESIKKSSTLPWMTGVTREEGLLFYQVNYFANSRYGDLSIIKTDGDRLLPIIGYYSAHPNVDEVTKKLKKYYLKNVFDKYSTKNFVQLMSDLMFNYGIYLTTKNYKGKVYKFLLSHQGQTSLGIYRPIGTENLTTHTDDTFYMFPKFFFIPMIKLSEKDEKISNSLMDMVYNFVKTGDPTPENHLWEESDSGKKYLDFSDDGLIMKNDMFQERMHFLDTIKPLEKL